MNKELALILVAFMALPSASCLATDNATAPSSTVLISSSATGDNDKNETPCTMTGQVKSIDSYGMLVPSFTPQQLKDAGFEYGDCMDIKVGDNIEIRNVPFITGFNEVGVFEACFCDYNALGKMYGIGQLHGNFHERIGGEVGDKVVFTLSKRQGYKNTLKVMKSIYTYDRQEYKNETDEEFTNFRPVTTTGMGYGILYRSSNPLNPKDNAVRYAYADSLARHYGIKTEIDLADTNEKIENYMKYDDYKSTYCPDLYHEGKVIALGLTADIYSKTFMQKLGEGLRFMLHNEPPYLVHCNEGKDRCGFVSFLLESLAGADYQEVTADYMKTLLNFYQIKPGSKSYKMRQRLSIDRIIWLLQNLDSVTDFSSIDWKGKDPTRVNLQFAAQKYIMRCGLTPDECDQLRQKLQGKKK